MTEITPEDINKASSVNEDTFNDAGLTDEYMARKLKQLTGAMEVKAQIPKGETEFSYSKRMKALDVRLKALDLAYKLKGKVPAEKHEVDEAISVNFSVTPIKKKDG